MSGQPADEHHEVLLTVNGGEQRLHVPARRLLSDALRDDLALTGTHVGCEHGVCGACTVLVDDEPVRSCLMLAVQADGCRVETVEGLGDAAGALHPLQEAVSRNRGLQCGFCTAGFLMLGEGWLRRGQSREQARACVGSNLCRCTGYAGLVAAFDEVAGESSDDPEIHEKSH